LPKKKRRYFHKVGCGWGQGVVLPQALPKSFKQHNLSVIFLQVFSKPGTMKIRVWKRNWWVWRN
jgi:hypothetical protein